MVCEASAEAKNERSSAVDEQEMHNACFDSTACSQHFTQQHIG